MITINNDPFQEYQKILPIVNQSSRKIQNRFTWLSHSCLNEKLKVSMPCMRFADVQMI